MFDGALGAVPTAVTIAGIEGMLGSVITSVSTSGASGQGAQHVTLRHDFVSPNVCRVNDVMEIVSGTGVFENASGQLVNHGTINLHTFTLSYSTRGRVCGDGV